MRSLIFFIICGLLPGTIIWASISRKISLVETIICGFVISQSLIAIGLIFSRNINVYGGRYVPLLMSGLLLPKTVKNLKVKSLIFSASKKRYLIFPFTGSVMLLPQALNSASISTLNGKGPLFIDTDIQFLLSLASESIHRVPSVYPHAADTHIAYTWLFSGIIGFWSNLTNEETIRIMLFYWPIFFSLTFPILVFTIVYQLTNKHIPAIVGCIAVVIFGGPKMPNALDWLTASPIYLWSPHRDFAALLILTLLLSVHAFDSAPRKLSVRITQGAILFAITFTMIGSKGSIFLLLVGAGICSLVLNFSRSIRNFPSFLFIWTPIGAGAIASQLLVVRMSGYAHFSLPSASFISIQTSHRLFIALFFFGSVTILCNVPVALLVYFRELDRNILALLIGIPLSVIPGILFVSHPGQSQFYFWQSAIPIFLIAASVLLTRVLAEVRKPSLLLVAGLLASSQFINWNINFHNFIYAQVALVLLLFAVTFSRNSYKHSLTARRRFISVAVVCPLAFVSLVPIRTGPVGAWEGYSDSVFINQDYVQSLHWMRANTPIDALVATNKHCSRGSIAQDNCSDRWFIFSALSERRFISEGRGYTWRQSVPWNNFAKLSDQVILNPSTNNLKELQNLGVQYLYVDLGSPYSRSLKYSVKLLYSNNSSHVYSLEK